MSEPHTGAWVIYPHGRVDLCSETDKARDPPPSTSEYPLSSSRGISVTGSFPVGLPAKQSGLEIRNGKIVFRQKPMSFEKMTETMQGV